MTHNVSFTPMRFRPFTMKNSRNDFIYIANGIKICMQKSCRPTWLLKQMHDLKSRKITQNRLTVYNT